MGSPVEDGFESGFFEGGFNEGGGTELAKWRGIRASNNVHLLKLHGSTDWYLADDGSVYKLRHAMPLYGALVLMERGKNNPTLKSALVLPSQEKMTTQPPYPSLATEFRNSAEQADVAIFLGTSLRDQDMRDVCSLCANRVPTFVVSRGANYGQGYLPPTATVLKQSASRFLISTLPNFLRQENIDALGAHTESEENDTSSVLEWLMIAGDHNRQLDDRSHAIEKLAGTRVRLEKQEVEQLLGADELLIRLMH